MDSIRVDLAKGVDDSYDIKIGAGFIAPVLDELKDGFFVADSSVHSLYPELFEDKRVFVLEASEEAKSFDSFIGILDFLNRNGCRRDGRLIAAGGGITGDITGFAAASYMRGIGYIQVPTTLLSMVDSSVGGKTGINFNGAKNNIGAFCQPEAVYIDTDFLKTLTPQEYLNGVAEVIKYGAVFDTHFFEYLEQNRDGLLKLEPETLKYVISECCLMKAGVVKRDEKEQGERKLLNFGHTFGHAVETDSHFEVKHGFAVALGMYLENLFGVKLGLCKAEAAAQTLKILTSYGFETDYVIKDTDLFFSALSSDKKADKRGLSLALTPEIGSGIIVNGVSMDSVREFFKSPI